ncbi:MAG: type II secretion system F family protein [Selenomonadaceae bacterium]|nr:type II secretion system F family protein [Selenomonadaceae bacterium]
MVFVMSFIAGWGCFAFFAWLLVYKTQSPEAQLRKRLDAMIRQAELERAKLPISFKKPKAEVKTVVNPQQAVKRSLSFFERVIQPFWDSLDERFQKFAPAEIKLQIEDKIFRAGKTGVWDARRFITIWCLMILLGIVGAIFFVQGQGFHPLQRMIIIFLGGFVGAMLPFAFLNSKIRQRQKSLRRQLPEFLDLLCVSVQAGLSFDGAVAKIVSRMEGPLIDEFRRFQNDVGLGMTHQYALNQVAKRCDLEEVYLFTTSVIQAERLGTSMTRTLKVQADNMRDRHRQWVRGEALKAPVKIIFPMVLFIFPSIFVVLLFPSVLTIVRNLGG